MLAQLSTVKARLGLDPLIVKDDAMLTSVIAAMSVRFDRECGRTLERTEGFMQEFDGDRTELPLCCFPVEAVAKFEVKESETLGWVELSAVEFIVRRSCLVALREPLGSCASVIRLTYNGGYVPPGTGVGPGQTPLPADLAMASIEQAACWYMNRDRLGLVRQWPKGGDYLQISELDLLPSVAAVLRTYLRMMN